jgi:hypothetical protein
MVLGMEGSHRRRRATDLGTVAGHRGSGESGGGYGGMKTEEDSYGGSGYGYGKKVAVEVESEYGQSPMERRLVVHMAMTRLLGEAGCLIVYCFVPMHVVVINLFSVRLLLSR